jgi:outer membrane lipoprotein SlyB
MGSVQFVKNIQIEGTKSGVGTVGGGKGFILVAAGERVRVLSGSDGTTHVVR